MIVTVTIIVAAAFIGLFLINVDRVSADKTSTLGILTESASDNPNNEQAQNSPFESGSLALSTIKMISALVVVVVCIYLGIFLLKKAMGRHHGINGKNNVLQVLETTYVGPKKTVSLIRVADRSVLVGVTDNQISVLTELDADETAAITSEKVVSENEGFNLIFKSAVERIKKLSPKRDRAVLEN